MDPPTCVRVLLQAVMRHALEDKTSAAAGNGDPHDRGIASSPRAAVRVPVQHPVQATAGSRRLAIQK